MERAGSASFRSLRFFEINVVRPTPATGSTVMSISLWRKVIADESGQDLVEYALMASFVGVAGYLVLMSLGVDIFNVYESWLDPTVGVPSVWEPPPPSGGGS